MDLLRWTELGVPSGFAGMQPTGRQRPQWGRPHCPKYPQPVRLSGKQFEETFENTQWRKVLPTVRKATLPKLPARLDLPSNVTKTLVTEPN